MAHSFLRKMLTDEAKRFKLQIFTSILGSALLLNSFIVHILYQNDELYSLTAMSGAILLGVPLVWQALVDLWKGNYEMNELAALSFLASFCVGEYQTSAAIAFFMILTQMLEYRSQLGARKNIESLLRLSPNKACRIENGEEHIIDALELNKGDIVRVRHGEFIPGDGVVIKGTSSVDESSITGESMPVEKKESDKVFGGSVNHSGILEVEILATSSDSTLSRIKDLIIEAENSRTPVMRLIDKYANWYTPIILIIAAMVLFFTRDVNRSISILIISCPCTILLSSPTAIVAALSSAARLGVIFKNVSVIEIANKINAMIFDKTGTLTTGKLYVTHIHPLGEYSEKYVLTLAASISFNSRHPVAQALINMADQINIQYLKADNFKEVSGMGTTAEIKNEQILLGRKEWLKQHKISIPVISKEISNYSLLYVVKEETVIGCIALEDKIKQDAPQIISELKKNSISKIIMLTGDRKEVAHKVAAELNCEVDAEVLPAQKMERVEKLKEEGYVVAVVGDGVNDAPALAAGDISIAMGAAGSDVAIHSASIVLMNDKLDRIPFIIQLSHSTMRKIRENLIFSACYILLLLILSVFGVIHPILAVIMHTASTLIVIFNSARLLREGENMS